jgi:hypothetical protein
MTARLKCISGDLAGQRFELEDGHTYTVGRENSADESNFILLSSPTVSRRHCRISADRGSITVEDLQSANGIRVNKQATQKKKLRQGDLLQIGAFNFTVEMGSETRSTESESDTGKKISSIPPQLQQAKEHWSRFHKIDIRHRVLLLLLFAGLMIHLGITTPLVSDMRSNLLELSISVGENSVQSLADRNKRELANAAYHTLDCETILKSSSEILSAQIYDAKGRVVCPVGANGIQDDLLDNALYRSESKNNCRERILRSSMPDCDFVFPVRGWRDQEGQFATVGVARIKYSPKAADLAVQNLQSLQWKLLFFCFAVLAAIWAIWQVWIRREIDVAVESTHLAVTGAAQNLENLESFAALDPLIQEINRLIAKENQGLKEKSAGVTEEASFLHSLLQQVLLLEERAVMVVDKENQLIAASRTLPELIPVEVSRMNIHITEAVTDTHLQGELIVLLNDLAQSNEVIDRALAMADRMIQARGMALFLREDFVASILVF